jgi:hypothetical protein
MRYELSNFEWTAIKPMPGTSPCPIVPAMV